MMIAIKKNSKIFIYCPAGVATGGPEALHQLRYYLQKCGYCAYLVYYGQTERPTPQKYAQYRPLTAEIIDDAPNNVVIVPEQSTYFLNKIQHAYKCIWWLSAEYYDGKGGRLRRFLKTGRSFTLNRNLKEFARLLNPDYKPVYPHKVHIDAHLCASKFAFDYVEKTFCVRPVMMVEPISKEFLDYEAENPLARVNGSRENVVAYNPSKPSKIMKKLLKRQDLTFVPIRGMTPVQIAQLFRKIKLYVDFGPFGGPERIPKEAVYNGCCILVANHNAAANDFDVAIDPEFKLDCFRDEKKVVEKIKAVLEDYDETLGKFEFFRNKIARLEENFCEAIQKVFVCEE